MASGARAQSQNLNYDRIMLLFLLLSLLIVTLSRLRAGQTFCQQATNRKTRLISGKVTKELHCLEINSFTNCTLDVRSGLHARYKASDNVNGYSSCSLTVRAPLNVTIEFTKPVLFCLL